MSTGAVVVVTHQLLHLRAGDFVRWVWWSFSVLDNHTVVVVVVT